MSGFESEALPEVCTSDNSPQSELRRPYTLNPEPENTNFFAKCSLQWPHADPSSRIWLRSGKEMMR